MPPMKVVILCGGMGTRLREETEFKPKPMVEIGGRPILWHIMKLYAHYGFDDFILCLGYKGHIIKEYFLNYHCMNNDFRIRLDTRDRIEVLGSHNENWTVTLADTGATTLTGGRLNQVQKYLGDEPFLLTYGDGVADVDLHRLVEFHRSHGKHATLTGVKALFRFGVVATDQRGSVTAFKEKPQLDDFINVGFFVFQPAIFDYLTNDCMLERQPLEALAARGHLAIYEHPGYWQCMDTYRDYQVLTEAWDSGRAPWAVWQIGGAA